MARSARDAFDSKNLLEIVFFCKPREKNLISLETTAETKESGMKLKSGRRADGRVTENPEIGRKRRRGREIRGSLNLLKTQTEISGCDQQRGRIQAVCNERIRTEWIFLLSPYSLFLLSSFFSICSFK